MAVLLLIYLGLVSYDGADAVFRFKFDVDAVERWRYFDWMCLCRVNFGCRWVWLYVASVPRTRDELRRQ